MHRLCKRYVSYLIPEYSYLGTKITNIQQGIVKGFEDSGFKTQVQPLTHFQDDYGLKGGDDDDEDEGGEDDDDEGDEDAEMSDGSGDESQ